MDQKQINIIVDYHNIQALRPLLIKFRSKSSTFNIQKIEQGKYKGEILISFNVLSEHYDLIVERLKLKKINVIVDEEYDAIFEEGTIKNNHEAINSEGNNNKLKLQPNVDFDELDMMLSKGLANDVLHYSKEIIEYGNSLIATVHNVLEGAAQNAIINEKKKIAENSANKKESLIKIIKIASDETIHSIEESDISKIAGEEAVNICAEDIELIDELLNLCSDSKIHSKINLLAAIRFSEKVFEKDAASSCVLDRAVESLDIVWLDFAYQVFGKSFSDMENEHYKKLVDYVSAKRNSGP